MVTDRIFAGIPYKARQMAKTVPGYRWHDDLKQWSWPESQRDKVETMLAGIDGKARGNSQDKSFDLPDNMLDVSGVVLDYTFKRKPWPHQINGLKAIVKYRQVGLWWEMGVGKTKVVIDAVRCLSRSGQVGRALIVAPKSVLENWSAEIFAETGLTSQVAKGCKNKVKKLLTNPETLFTIVNYERLLGLDAIGDYDFVCLDESQKVKNHKAKITKMILKTFSEKDIYKVCLSGTPISQDIGDIWSQMQFLNPSILSERSYYGFAGRYLVMGGYGNYQVVGVRNQDQLRKMICTRSSALRKESCHDLPDKIYQRRYLDMPDAVEAQYKQMYDNLMLELSDYEVVTASAAIVKILRLQEITSGHYLENQADNTKLSELVDIIKEQRKPAIVWVKYIKSLEIIRAALEQYGVKCSVYWGGLSADEREIEKQKFDAGKTDVFIGQVRTGGLGISLVRASLVIYYENEYSLMARRQSEDRAHRPGQKNNVVYIDLLYHKSIDLLVLKALKEKQDGALYLINSFKRGSYETNMAE